MITVKIELASGPRGESAVTKREMQKNIDALERAAASSQTTARDLVLLTDTVSILRGIQKQLTP